MKKTLALFVIGLACLGIRDSSAALISCYNFNEGIGATIADSVRGGSGSGTVSGAYAWDSGANAVSGSSLRFYGPGNSLTGALAPMVSGVTTGFTLSAWAKFDSFTFDGSVVKNWGTASNGAIYLGLAGNNSFYYSLIWNASLNTSAVLGQMLTLGQWYNIVTTYDGTTQRVYLNGVLDGQYNLNGNLNLTNTNLTFGAQSNVSGGFDSQINGWIDEISIYNVALSVGDVSTLYTNGANGIGAGGLSAVPEPSQVAASMLILAGIGGYVFLNRRKPAQPPLVPPAHFLLRQIRFTITALRLSRQQRWPSLKNTRFSGW